MLLIFSNISQSTEHVLSKYWTRKDFIEYSISTIKIEFKHNISIRKQKKEENLQFYDVLFNNVDYLVTKPNGFSEKDFNYRKVFLAVRKGNIYDL